MMLDYAFMLKRPAQLKLSAQKRLKMPENGLKMLILWAIMMYQTKILDKKCIV